MKKQPPKVQENEQKRIDSDRGIPATKEEGRQATIPASSCLHGPGAKCSPRSVHSGESRHRKTHKLSGLGKQKRKTGRLWMLKRVGESTSLTDPWTHEYKTTRVQNMRLSAAQQKAKDLSRVRIYCISNRVLRFQSSQENDPLKQRKHYLPVGNNRIQSFHNFTFIMSRTQSKISQHMKKKENKTHSQKKRKSN